jgi:hypothetical protein
MEQEEKRGRGRPKVETYLDPEWYSIIVESGREGRHITDYLIKLGISWDTHYELLKRNTKYSEAFKEYNKLCEQWWYERAHEAVMKGESNKFNQRLWLQIVKNKFRDNWKDEKQLDVTTKGDKLNEDKSFQIEIINPNINNQDVGRED